MTNHDLCVDTVRRTLERLDPQLPGADVRAERIVAELEDAGLLHHGRRIQALDLREVAAWL